MKKIKEENKERYVADFETAQDLDDETYVWAWACCDCKTMKTEYGTDINSYMNHILDLKDGAVIYFHNLKFDGNFVVIWLLNNGYRQTSGNQYQMGENEFIAMVSDMGSWYSIKIRKNNKLITILDSLKKLPFSVKTIAKSLNFDEGKGEIDYKKHRDEGGILTDEDKDYIRRDVEIIAKALNELFFSRNLYRLTIGSDCLTQYQKMFKNFTTYFPVLPEEIDTFCRNAYKGGYCYKNPNISKIFTTGSTYDFNSMYPSVMHSMMGYDYPIGNPEYFVGSYEYDSRYPLFICHIKTIFKLKEGYVPTIQIKHDLMFVPNEYLETSNGDVVELYMTNIDLEIFFNHYDVLYIEYIDGYKFHAARGMFDKYIDYFYEMKEKATITKNKVERMIAKLFLNNLYGKFASSANADYMMFSLDNNVLKRKAVVSKKDTIYVPVGCFITAYARKELLTAIQNNYENFCYCDTDSIHISKTEATGIKVDDTALGCWKKESVWDEAIFLRQKTYAEKINNEWDIKCAGLPDNCKKNMTIDQFYIGSEIPGKLQTKQVRGGVKLIEGTFKIKPVI